VKLGEDLGRDLGREIGSISLGIRDDDISTAPRIFLDHWVGLMRSGMGLKRLRWV